MRFLLFILVAAAFGIGLHLAIIYGPVSYEQFRLLLHGANQQSQLAHLPRLALTAGRYAGLRGTAALVLVLSGGLTWRLSRHGAPRALLAEAAAAARALKAGWSALVYAERGLAVALLLAIGGGRL